MPFYEYQHTDEMGPDCKPVFDHLQRMSEEPLTECPICGKPVQRLISKPTVQVNKLSKSNLENMGFTQFKKVGDGEYEKTAGEGPRNIIDTSR